MKTAAKEPKETYRTMLDIVYNWLRNEIVTGAYKPGTKISQEMIAETLGVSRMPVREAIRRLQAEGLVTSTPHKGCVVTQLTKEELEELYDIRLALETLAMRLATANITNEELRNVEAIFTKMTKAARNNEYNFKINQQFHMAIYEASKRPRLVRMLASIWASIEPYRRAFTSLPGRIPVALEHHRCMLEALQSRDADKAVHYVQEHLKEVSAELHNFLDNPLL